MKVLMVLLTLVFCSQSFAVDYGYLKKEDQKFYKNDSFEGSNKIERIDSLVKEVNKMYGEMASMKSEISKLREEVELLKAKK